MNMDVETLGQVFTPEETVSGMIQLMENPVGPGVLEPSCGAGAFSNHLPGCVALELDPRHAPSYAFVTDFFAYTPNKMFSTIIGNPPFVKYKDISETTKALLPEAFDKRTNLYVFFINKCLDFLKDGGELIFINPRDFLKATHAAPLNERLFKEGGFTHMQDLGDARIFPGYGPNCVIFRWVKGRRDPHLYDGRKTYFNHGQLSFLDAGVETSLHLSDIFEVRVGGVSGMDGVFSNPDVIKKTPSEFVHAFACSQTHSTGQTRQVIWADGSDVAPESLQTFKSDLLARRAKRFGEKDWWTWVRKPPRFLAQPAILVNGKTRKENPFYVHQGSYVDGSLLALYPKGEVDVSKLAHLLNSVEWSKKGFQSGNRFLFSQKALSNVSLGDEFEEFVFKA